MSGFQQLIADVLCHQEHEKVRREVARRNPCRDPLQHRTSWHALSENGNRLLAIEPASIDQCERLSEGNGLHSCQKIVDQFQQRTTAYRTEVNGTPAEHGENWFRRLEGGG